MSGGVVLRRAALAVLVVVVGVGFYRTSQVHASAERSGEAGAAGAAGRSFEQAASRLDERVAEYMALRKADDWVSIYELTDPDHRARVNRNSFLLMYGQGVLRVLEISATAATIDARTHTAKVTLSTTAQLVPERLPAQVRSSLHEEHPEHLQQTADYVQSWVWKGGDWYFEMDQELLTGRNDAGSAIRLLGEAR